MAARSSSGRGATASRNRPGNQTPATPRIRESDLGRMRVEEIRGELRRRGVSGISRQRKDELVKTLAKTLRAEQRKQAGSGKKQAAAAGEGAPAAKRTARTTRPAGKERSGGGQTRRGGGSSRSLKYAQRISSPDERPSRPGRSLVTTDHEVIRRWARARNAKPATVYGTEYDGRPGVLRFDFPGFQDDGRLRRISWEEWFDTFDRRKLNFIYQETRTNGGQSNFFRLESPGREDA
ncbi:MAG TPA: hypothetical protein VF174_03900 [Micromonosporaceae bacterium]